MVDEADGVRFLKASRLYDRYATLLMGRNHKLRESLPVEVRGDLDAKFLYCFKLRLGKDWPLTPRPCCGGPVGSPSAAAGSPWAMISANCLGNPTETQATERTVAGPQQLQQI